MKQALLVLALLCALTQAFSILPGVEPNEYAADSVLNIKVNGLASVKAQIPYEYYYLPFPKVLDLLNPIFLFFNSQKRLSTKKKHSVRCSRAPTSRTPFTMSRSCRMRAVGVPSLISPSLGIVIGDVTYNQQQSELFSELISDEYVGNLLLDNLPVSMKIVSESNVLYASRSMIDPIATSTAIPLAETSSSPRTAPFLERPSTITSISPFSTTPLRTERSRSSASRSPPRGMSPSSSFDASSINHQSDPDFSEDGVQSHKLSTCNKQNAIQPIFGETEAKDDVFAQTSYSFLE